MYKFEAEEAAPICERVLTVLLKFAPAQGRPGFDLRNAVGDFVSDSYELLYTDQAGPPLNEIFVLARKVGMTIYQLDRVRVAAESEAPVTIGAFIVKNVLLELALATECEIIANMTFTSRDDVDLIRDRMNGAFAAQEEIAADEMAQDTYQTIIRLHSALMFFLTDRARPLPRMLRYRFYSVLPSMVTSYKLYADASRGDEMRAENKVIHPAFMPRAGKALSN